MSSILRALKKLENEPRHLEKNQPLESKFVSFADTAPQRTFSRIFMMVLGGGIVCGLVILAGWWLFSEKFQPPLDRTQNSSAVSEIPAKASIEAAAIQEPTEQITKESKPASIEESASRIIDQEDVSSVKEQTPGGDSPGSENSKLKNRRTGHPAC